MSNNYFIDYHFLDKNYNAGIFNDDARKEIDAERTLHGISYEDSKDFASFLEKLVGEIFIHILAMDIPVHKQVRDKVSGIMRILSSYKRLCNSNGIDEREDFVVDNDELAEVLSFYSYYLKRIMPRFIHDILPGLPSDISYSVPKVSRTEHIVTKQDYQSIGNLFTNIVSIGISDVSNSWTGGRPVSAYPDFLFSIGGKHDDYNPIANDIDRFMCMIAGIKGINFIAKNKNRRPNLNLSDMQKVGVELFCSEYKTLCI